jgi:hypothetical protein
MSYTLAAAAAATGQSKTAILKAIKDGKIAGTKDDLGEWHIEPAELHLVYPPLAECSEDIEALGAQIEALLRQAGERLRQQIADAHGRDVGADRPRKLQLVDQHGDR